MCAKKKEKKEPKAGAKREYAWKPQKGPQLDAITATWCEELFFGGARFGGKSDYLLGDFIQDVHTYKQHWQGVIFRRSYKQLEDLIRRSHELFPSTGAEWLEGKSRWSWPNGAMLRFRFLDVDRDAENYQGHSFSWIGWDELGNFPSRDPYDKLKACCRWGAADVPTKRIRATGNPGGPGQGWIKDYFIDHAPLGRRIRVDSNTKHKIMFIPSRVTDNIIGLERDPGYIDRLRGTGSPELVRAWLEGDWNAVVGGYFPEFGERHIIAPFEIPKHWTLFRAMDWGSARPFSVLWMCVSDGTLRQFPTGAVIVYREWYGASAPNVGLKMHVAEVAEGIKWREQGEHITYAVADPACFHEDGGPSIAEQFSNYGVMWKPGDNKRIPGWTQVRNRLIGHDGRSMLYVVGVGCRDLIRTFPMQMHDERKPEDMDTEGEDHSLDCLRYGLQTRPYTAPITTVDPFKDMARKITYGEFLAQNKKKKAMVRARV